MRRLAGGVAIVTARSCGRPYGMTMTAVMSLTLEPPALLIAVNQSASMAPLLVEGAEFCVNLLHANHHAMCEQFSALPSAERFSVGTWADGRAGLPFLPDAEAAIFCTVGPCHMFGTHRMVIGLVEEVRLGGPICPLLHIDGRYCHVDIAALPPR
jgi:flavin reductase (DIM6/NTAB) family NADH-FMN oxidoreductase RutF